MFPVGRLDADTEGLLLLTNDGELANRIAHPRHGVDKEYLADGRRRGRSPPARVRRLRDGVELDDGLTAPAKVSQPSPGVLRITIHEGRNRQVRRMCEAVGHPVTRLVRTRIGPLQRPPRSRPATWRDRSTRRRGATGSAGGTTEPRAPPVRSRRVSGRRRPRRAAPRQRDRPRADRRLDRPRPARAAAGTSPATTSTPAASTRRSTLGLRRRRRPRPRRRRSRSSPCPCWPSPTRSSGRWPRPTGVVTDVGSVKGAICRGRRRPPLRRRPPDGRQRARRARRRRRGDVQRRRLGAHARRRHRRRDVRRRRRASSPSSAPRSWRWRPTATTRWSPSSATCPHLTAASLMGARRRPRRGARRPAAPRRRRLPRHDPRRQRPARHLARHLRREPPGDRRPRSTR